MRLGTVLVKDEERVRDLMYDRQKLLLTIATLYPVYTIQPVVKLVFDSRLDKRFDNRLYRVNGALVVLLIQTVLSNKYLLMQTTCD